MIDRVSDDGKVLTLTKPLLYEHWGAGWSSPGGATIDEYRASVGLLSRNIVVQGDEHTKGDRESGSDVVSK